MAHEFIGAKLFPDRYERDRVIWEYIKDRNRTEVLKEALYRMALVEKSAMSPSVNAELVQHIMAMINAQTHSVQSPSPIVQEKPHILSVQEETVPHIHAVESTDLSLDAMENTGAEEEHSDPGTYDPKILKQNFLSSISGMKF